MKKLLTSALILPVLAGGITGVNAQVNGNGPEFTSVILSNESKLTINGQSNVTDFTCVSKHDLEDDSLSFRYQYQGTDVELTGKPLVLKVDNFDCGKRGINRDFRKTLKHKDYPQIKIELIELNGRKSPEALPTTAEVNIELAGVSRNYTIELSEVMLFDERTRVKGQKSLKMSDFDLDPPSPLFGLIKIHDEMLIDFNLIIRDPKKQ